MSEHDRPWTGLAAGQGDLEQVLAGFARTGNAGTGFARTGFARAGNASAGSSS